MALSLALGGALAACADGLSSQRGNINDWNLVMSDLAGPGGLTCNTSGIVLHLPPTLEPTFVGDYSGGQFTCVDSANQASTADVGSGQVINGASTINTVMFDFDSSGNVFTGEKASGHMQGSVTLGVNLPGVGVVRLSGNWIALRPIG